MKALTLVMPNGYERRLDLDLSQPCVLWTGATRHGYGIIMVDSAEKYVHRLAYQLHVGPIPRCWEIDHVCHTAALALDLCAGGEACPHRPCWNPAHLEAVSNEENRRRGNHFLFSPRRREICGRGHDLTDPANVYTRPNGRRRCRRCAVLTQRDRRRSSKR